MATDNCLYVGRFRIFHQGYWEVTKHILAETGSGLILAVGAAQVPPCRDNPFTSTERALMIEAALREEERQHRIHVITIDETPATYDTWTHLVKGLCPPFSCVYSHSDLVRNLFRRVGYRAKSVPEFSSVEFSFASIARKIVKGEPWEDLLPESVADFMTSARAGPEGEKAFCRRKNILLIASGAHQ